MGDGLAFTLWSHCDLCDRQFRQYVIGKPSRVVCPNCLDAQLKAATGMSRTERVRAATAC